MQDAVPVGMGSMVAVLGMKTDEIIDLLKTEKLNNGVCEIANDNANGQTIVSGNKVDVNYFKRY